jgi:hypothetical protein
MGSHNLTDNGGPTASGNMKQNSQFRFFMKTKSLEMPHSKINLRGPTSIFIYIYVPQSFLTISITWVVH